MHPFLFTSPLVGFMIPAIKFNIVDFPVPLGPTTAIIFPSSKSNEISSITSSTVSLRK